MDRRPPRSHGTATLFPYTPPVRSPGGDGRFDRGPLPLPRPHPDRIRQHPAAVVEDPRPDREAQPAPRARRPRIRYGAGSAAQRHRAAHHAALTSAGQRDLIRQRKAPWLRYDERRGRKKWVSMGRLRWELVQEKTKT